MKLREGIALRLGQFIIEIEENNKLNFLDLDIIRIENSFAKTNWFKKPSFSGHYLNYHSHHPTAHKIGVIYNLVDKCIKISDIEYHQNNLEEVKNILIHNNYPIHFLNKYMKIRINTLKSNNPHPPSVTNNKQIMLRRKKVVLPFYKNLTENINYNLKKQNNILPLNKITNKLNSLIVLGKDKLNRLDNQNVVYNIDCQNCNAIYIGQTSQK